MVNKIIILLLTGVQEAGSVAKAGLPISRVHFCFRLEVSPKDHIKTDSGKRLLLHVSADFPQKVPVAVKNETQKGATAWFILFGACINVSVSK